jgi:D-serine deaminase-like pyridoxal phosphate-dependent protein
LLLSVQGGVHSDAETHFSLIELARRAGPGGAMIVVDHPCNVAERAHAVARLERPLDVLIDYGAGHIRIGVASATGVLDFAARIGEEPRGEHA